MQKKIGDIVAQATERINTLNSLIKIGLCMMPTLFKPCYVFATYWQFLSLTLCTCLGTQSTQGTLTHEFLCHFRSLDEIHPTRRSRSPTRHHDASRSPVDHRARDVDTQYLSEQDRYMSKLWILCSELFVLI
jgi:hypothetical protein